MTGRKDTFALKTGPITVGTMKYDAYEVQLEEVIYVHESVLDA